MSKVNQLSSVFSVALFALTALFWLAASPVTQAGETGASKGDLIFEKSERINRSRGGTKLVTRTLIGKSRDKGEKGPFNDAYFRCHITFVIYEKSNAPADGSGYCSGIGEQGNTWDLLLDGNQNGGTWKFVDGTGRYENIKGSGTWRRSGEERNMTERYEWKGKWELQK